MTDSLSLALRSARLLEGKRYWHQPQCPEALLPGQAQENREYVRRLLKERQPDFAAVLESVVRELACQMCPGPG
jgi:hypothetical protein